MNVNGAGMRIGVAALALGLSFFTISTSLEAQKATGIGRVGWLEVCSPVLNAPISILSGLGSRNWAMPRGRIS